jgi:hypothetical protein
MKHTKLILMLVYMLLSMLTSSFIIHAERTTPKADLSPLILNSFVDIVPNEQHWRGTDRFEEGWFEDNHDETQWSQLSFADFLDPHDIYHFSTPAVYYSNRNGEPAYIRGHVRWDQGFENENQVKKVFVTVCANHDFEFYMNGILVGSEVNQMVGPLKVYDVTHLWQIGALDNVFAAEVSTPDIRSSLYISVRVYFDQT